MVSDWFGLNQGSLAGDGAAFLAVSNVKQPFYCLLAHQHVEEGECLVSHSKSH